MKQYYTISLMLVLFLLNFEIEAQECNNTHSTTTEDSWLSCTLTPNPNPARSSSHWVQYDLGYTYSIASTKFWNYNVAGATAQGFKNVAIDYSLDGITWMTLTTFLLSEADGLVDYLGEDGPDFGGISTRYVLISAIDTWGDGTCAGLSEVRFDLLPLGVELSAKVMLEGAYNPSTLLMDDVLRSQGVIPTSEPFSSLGFVAVNNAVTENIAPALLNTTGNNAIIDWLFVSLYAENDPGTVVATRSALLQKDGDVVDLDGVSSLAFSSVAAGNYFIAIRGRNHLSITSLNAISLGNASLTTLDFTSSATAVVGLNPRKNINGVLLLWAGDATADNIVNASDRAQTWNMRNQSSYLISDVNMDGQCNAADRALTWNNRNKSGN